MGFHPPRCFSGETHIFPWPVENPLVPQAPRPIAPKEQILSDLFGGSASYRKASRRASRFAHSLGRSRQHILSRFLVNYDAFACVSGNTLQRFDSYDTESKKLVVDESIPCSAQHWPSPIILHGTRLPLQRTGRKSITAQPEKLLVVQAGLLR